MYHKHRLDKEGAAGARQRDDVEKRREKKRVERVATIGGRQELNMERVSLARHTRAHTHTTQHKKADREQMEWTDEGHT